MSELSNTLKQEAIGHGLCEAWQNGWKDNSTQQELINKYLRGIDFCLQHHWPTADFIRNNFCLDLLRRNGILANDRISIRDKEEIVISGNSDIIVRIDGNTSSRIYIGDNSKARIFVKNHEKVIIEVRDKAYVEVFADDYYHPDVSVYEYSENSTVVAADNVKYTKEEDYLK